LEAIGRNQYVPALAMVEQLLAAQPQQARYLHWQSLCLLGLDNPAGALDAARQAVAADPQLAQAYLPLAWSARRLGRRQEAHDAFELALTLTHRDPAVLVEYADFLAAERAPTVAEPVARQAVAAAPSAPAGWRALGWTLMRLHKLDEAEACLRKALELAPGDAGSMICLAQLLNQTARPAEARDLARMLGWDPALADVAEELHRDSARRLRILARPDERVTRYIPPAEDRGEQWQELSAFLLGPMLWILAGVLVVGGALVAFVPPGRPTGLGITKLGLILVLIQWYRREL
jgi:tetratricopeptide (TPR) repeat protein